MCHAIKSQPASMDTICVNPCFLFLGLTLNPLPRFDPESPPERREQRQARGVSRHGR